MICRYMLFADDIVRVGESPEEVNGRLKNWREAFEGNGLRISRSKVEYVEYYFKENRER